MSTPTYTLAYDDASKNPFASMEATAHDLGELIALIDQLVVRDDYCWITVNQDGVETGHGQYYHVVAPGRVVDGIEEHGTAKGLCERINEVEQAALDKMRGEAH